MDRVTARPAGRNANETRRRILEAALAEFAAKGLAGARVDQIAAAAQCNKSLIFVYFESKAALFRTLVEGQLSRLKSEVEFQSGSLPAVAAQLFDFAMKNPNSMRLLAWYGLEHDKSELMPSSAKPIATMESFPRSSDMRAALPADFLLASIVALSTGWSQGNPIRQLLVPSGHESSSDLRKLVVEAARTLV